MKTTEQMRYRTPDGETLTRDVKILLLKILREGQFTDADKEGLRCGLHSPMVIFDSLRDCKRQYEDDFADTQGQSPCPQRNDKVRTGKRFFQVCFHLLHCLDHKIQMEFRLDEIQGQFKVVPLYDEFIQLLKGPAGQFNTHILSVSVPLRFPEIAGNLPVLFHPRLRCQHVLLDIPGAQHIAIRYHLIQPENHIFQMPCIKS